MYMFKFFLLAYIEKVKMNGSSNSSKSNIPQLKPSLLEKHNYDLFSAQEQEPTWFVIQ